MNWTRAFTSLKERLVSGGAETEPLTAAQLLEKTRLFRELETTEFEDLCRSVRTLTFRDGDLILKEGDAGDALFVIQSGAVRVFTADADGNEIVLARLEAGRYFGEQALLQRPPGKRNASVRAVSDVQLLQISHEHISAALTRDRKLRQTFESEGSRQLVNRLASASAIFRSLKGDAARSFAGNIREYADGATVFAQGDAPDAVYVVLSGTVEIRFGPDGAAGASVTRLGEGQIFGELGVLKQRARTGTAVARGPVRLLVISRKLFQEMHRSTPELRELTSALERVYEVPHRGTVTLHRGSSSGVETVSSLFALDDGGVVLGSQAVGQDLFSMSRADAPAAETVRFEDAGVKRELAVSGSCLVGITSAGQWDQLGRACSLLLDGAALQPWQLPLFRHTGDLIATVQPPTADPAETCCHCMKVSRGSVLDAIRAGAGAVDVVSSHTGAGTICGGCRGEIAALLGAATWSMVYIEQFSALAPDIATYRLKPYDGAVLPHVPGQYCLIQALIGRNWIERAYTLTSVSPSQDWYEIAVKREPQGYLSRWLFEHAGSQPLLRVSAPQGTFTFDVAVERPAVAFVGGIGVTPAVAFARALSACRGARPLHIDYSARTPEALAFAAELDSLKGDCPALSVRLRVTGQEGRVTREDIAAVCQRHAAADFYVCGPDAFMQHVCDSLAAAGVSRDRIRIELFTPAGNPLPPG